MTRTVRLRTVAADQLCAWSMQLKRPIEIKEVWRWHATGKISTWYELTCVGTPAQDLLFEMLVTGDPGLPLVDPTRTLVLEHYCATPEGKFEKIKTGL